MKIGDVVRVTTRAYSLERLTHLYKRHPVHFLEPGTMGVLVRPNAAMDRVWLVRMFNGASNGSSEEGWWLGEVDFELVAQGGGDESR